MENWKLLILEMDSSSKESANFFKRVWTDEIITKEITPFDYVKKETITNQVNEVTKNLEGKILTIYGHGDFHHYTYGLCNTIAKTRSDDYAYIHIDNHSGSIDNYNNNLSCESFVSSILEDPKAKKIILLGARDYSDEEHARIEQKTLINNLKRTTQRALKKIPSQDVYPSLDLDILSETELHAGHDQGILTLNHMINIIRLIKSEKNMVSADMLGYDDGTSWCNPYTINHSSSLLTYATLAAEITGKDTKELKKLHTHFKNKKPSKTLQKEFEKITEGLKI